MTDEQTQFRSYFKKIFFGSTVQNLFEVDPLCIVEHKKTNS